MKRENSRKLLSLMWIVMILASCFLVTPGIPYSAKETIMNFVVTPTQDPLELGLATAFSEYEKGEISYVALSKITSFSWDRLYVIGAYTTYFELTSRLGPSWMQCSTDITWRDTIVLLVFKRKHLVTHCLDFGIYPYDFSLLTSRYEGIPVADAIFIVQGRDGIVNTVSDK